MSAIVGRTLVDTPFEDDSFGWEKDHYQHEPITSSQPVKVHDARMISGCIASSANHLRDDQKTQVNCTDPPAGHYC